MIESVTQAALISALDALGTRQAVIADNIANVNTPGYHAKRVDFENALARSVAEHDGSVAPSVGYSTDPIRLDGNNVNLDTETLANIDTVLRYQFAAKALSQQFAGIRTALGSSS